MLIQVCTDRDQNFRNETINLSEWNMYLDIFLVLDLDIWVKSYSFNQLSIFERIELMHRFIVTMLSLVSFENAFFVRTSVISWFEIFLFITAKITTLPYRIGFCIIKRDENMALSRIRAEYFAKKCWQLDFFREIETGLSTTNYISRFGIKWQPYFYPSHCPRNKTEKQNTFPRFETLQFKTKWPN